jgi:hypothetical protein
LAYRVKGITQRVVFLPSGAFPGRAMRLDEAPKSFLFWWREVGLVLSDHRFNICEECSAKGSTHSRLADDL